MSSAGGPESVAALGPQPQITRKPISSDHNWTGLPPGLAHVSKPAQTLPGQAVRDDDNDDDDDAATLVDQVQGFSLGDVHKTEVSAVAPSEHTDTSLTGSTVVAEKEAEIPSAAPEAQPEGPSKLSKAWEEAKYFTGGLVHHPSESTKHYSILRHSHGVVYYQGPATSIAMSIFADGPLPPDRKLWLQQKGWAGKTGLKAKQLFGANGGWLDVTPSVQATADQLPKSSERAWQRDCRKFLQREGVRRRHKLRETCVVRIPCEAEDGYFRLVLCGGGKSKNRLCTSPVFRVASANTAPSSMKGASLSTLPLEAGIKIMSTMANNYASDQVQNVVGQYAPGFWEQEAASTAYGATGLQDKVNDANGTYQHVRDASYQHVRSVDDKVYEALDRAPMIGPETGPQKPYPFRMSSVVVAGSGISSKKHGLPTSNLKFVREEVTMSLHGVYFGWGRIQPTKALQSQSGASAVEGFYPTWHPAIIDVSVVPEAAFSVTYGAKKTVSAHLIHSFDNLVMNDCSIELVAMGMLRPHRDPSKLGDDPGARIKQDSDDMIADIAITQASLARPAWAIERAYMLRGWKEAGRGGGASEGEDEGPGKGKRMVEGLADRYVDARQAAQRQVDRVPVQRLGVRRHADVLKSQAVGTGGVYVIR